MSWRDILGWATDTQAQNPHYSQNTTKHDVSADCANTALQDRNFTRSLTDACKIVELSPLQLHQALSPEDVDDWIAGRFDDAALAALAMIVSENRQIDQGIVPEAFTQIAVCEGCGPVWLRVAGHVHGCPWCWNRAAGRPVPRPPGYRKFP